MRKIVFGSLFAGIGGFDLGFERADMRCAWQVEIDAKCGNVETRRFPNAERWEDVRDVGRHSLRPVDLVCGGFPCQDLSVAGKRKGLAGERSGLWFEFHRVLTELRPRWVVVENVPGLLSSNKGRDFTLILSGLAEIGYLSAWRVLDAQYFGLAQRRKRLFIVGSLGDGRAAQVLFESEGGCWNPPPSREKGQRIAAPLTRGSASSSGVNEPGRRQEDDVNLVADPITKSYAKHHGASAGKDSLLRNAVVVARPLAHGHTLDHHDESQQTYVLQCHGSNVGPMGALRRGNGGVTGGVPIIAFTGMAQAGAGWAPPSCPTSDDVGLPLDMKRAQTIAIQHSIIGRNEEAGAQGKGWRDDGASWTLDSRGEADAVASCFGVRRLTPTECERLQGFPDDWTAGQSDSARYRQLGNAVAVPVAEWIGGRIVELEMARQKAAAQRMREEL